MAIIALMHDSSTTRLKLIGVFLFSSMALAGCATPEDPARVELRARLKQAAVLSAQDLTRLLDEVTRGVGEKPVQFSGDAGSGELTKEQRDVVLGMLTNREGVFDEGLRTIGAATLRVVNAPGLSAHPEYSAARRLLVDVETFLPRRFEFSYEFQGMGDYELDLAIKN